MRDASAEPMPIPMILFCPVCGVQHIDGPETHHLDRELAVAGIDKTYSASWDNPPHRSHLCAACGCIWRPADVPTVGVARIQTRGQHDTFAADVGRVLERITIYPTQADAKAALVHINPRDRIEGGTEHRGWLPPPGEPFDYGSLTIPAAAREALARQCGSEGIPINQADEE